VYDFPLVRREEIAESYRPAGTASASSAVKTLRAHNVLGDGITLPIHGRDGRLIGRPVLYSALNRAAAHFARVGAMHEAHELTRQVRHIEAANREAISDAVATLRPLALRFPWLLFVGVRESQALAQALGALARQEAEVRADLTMPRVLEMKIGHVWSVKNQDAALALESGGRYKVFRSLLSPLGLDFKSAPVVIRYEQLSPQSVAIHVGAGLDVEGETAMAPSKMPADEWSPFTSEPLAATEERQAFVRAVAAGPARPRPVRRSSAD